MIDRRHKDLNGVTRLIVLLFVLLGYSACSGTPDVARDTLHSPKHSAAAPKQKVATKTTKPKPPKYVGLQVPPLPKGHETELGYLLEPEGQEKYAIEVVRIGSERLVWMGRLSHHDARGRAHWKIIAVLPPQKVPKGFYFSGGNCHSRGRPQQEIVAIFKMEDKKLFTQIRKAWKANPQKQHFEEVSPKEVQCINEAWNRL